MASLLFWLLTLVVCLAPLPFGGNQPWAWSGLALATGLLATLWGAASLADRRLVTMRRWRTLPYAGAFLLLALWYGLQASSLTPAGWHHEAWREAAAALEAPAGGSLSLTPDRTLTTLMRLATYAGIFWLAVHLLRSRRRARQFLWALSLAGAAYAAYGLVSHLGGSNLVLWMEKFSYREAVTGPFVNRNHAAAYAGAGLLVTLGLLLDRLQRVDAPAYRGWRSRLVLALDGLGFASWLLAAVLPVLLVALLLTGSRGGMAATLLSVPALFLLLGRGRRGRRRLLVPAAALAAVLALVLLQSGHLLERRLALPGVEGGGDRLALYALAVRLVAERPWGGSGLGSFAGVFLEQRDAVFGLQDLNQVRVHNSYLELLLEAGLPAGLLQIGLLAAMAAVLWRGARLPGPEGAPAAIALAVVLQLGLHSLLDFPLQMPGIAMTFAALLGLGIAQAYPHETRRG